MNGEVSKHDYINGIYKFHKNLFDYSEFISNTDIQKIEISDNSVIMTSRKLGLKIFCNKNDKRIPPIEILNFDCYEKNDSAMIFNLVDDDFTIFDIGANIGWYSLALTKLNNTIDIFAFEPVTKTYEILLKNIELNHIHNIYSFNHGFYSKNTELEFYYNMDGSGNASSKNLMDKKNTQKIKCAVKMLDSFVSTNNIEKIDMIKCDVEGAELFVFQGAENSIVKFKPIIFAEMLRKWTAKFDYHPNDIIKFFKNIEYLCFFVTDNELVQISNIDNDTLSTNFFFLHKEKHALQISKFCNNILNI